METATHCNDVASALDGLTRQLAVANQIKAAELLHEQSLGGMSTEDYTEFLWETFGQIGQLLEN